MITVIMPVYNEATQIFESVGTVRDILDHAAIEHQYLLVDDGSSDGTWDEICRLCQQFDNVSALRLSRNFGKELALCAALENASGDAVVVMDADLQHPPGLIVEMEKLWREQGYDVVEGIKENRGREARGMKLAALAFYRLFRKSTGIDIGVASDFKLLDRKVLDAWRKMPERTTFFRGMTAWVGFRRVQIPFTVAERKAGQTKWSLRALIGLAVNSVTSYTSAPLYFTAIVGAVLMLCAFVLLVQTIVMKIMGLAQDGFTTIIILQLMIGSCVTVSLGIIGLYLSKIYDETKRRPRYIVADERRQELLHESTEEPPE